jgi:aspartyl-tRNA(Asn)/glutamyl-tRNA(Gln) amidotransferase subunit A
VAEASGSPTAASTARELSALELVSAVAARQLHPREIVEEYLRGIEAEQHLNALITTCADAALKRAQEPLEGPLAGLPLIVKDILDTEGIRTTYGSALFRTHVPSKSAVAVTRAEDAGAIVIGKANLHEFAWGTTSQNPHYGSVQNPARPGKLAGGSSGGNAAALAASLCSLGLGTDTGGSARGPSACCSTVGFKAPYQAISTAGCFPFAPSFDTIAPMGRSVADCVLLYTTLTQAQPRRPTAAGLRIGILGRPPRVSPTGAVLEQSPAQRAWLLEQATRFEALGATVRDIELPEPQSDVLPAVLAEAAVVHHELYPAHRDQYGKDTQEKLDLARSVTAIAAHEARLAIAAWRARARDELAVDLVLCPTLGGDVPPMDAYEQDVRDVLLAYTRPFNLLDWSAIAIGDLQLAGPDEGVVLDAALAWEQAYGPPRPEREHEHVPS